MYPFTLRSPEGREYRISVPAGTEIEAEHILKSILHSLHYRDQIVTSPDRTANQARVSFARTLGKRNYQTFNWADKNTIYKTKQHKSW